MGSKRPFSDVESQDPGHAAGAPSFDPKRRKQYGSNRHKAKEGTSEFARKRVRNIERLLQRKQDLPANVRNDLERELASHKVDIADKGFQRKRSAMISKYHMVRFFERKKAARLVKQLQRQIEKNPDSEELDTLKRELHVAEVDEAYTIHHPHVEPYISLYGNAKSADNDEDAGKTPAARIALKAERPPMWSVVEKTMEEGPDALRKLRERRSADEAKPKLKRPQPKSSTTTKPSDGPKQPEKSKGRPQHHGKMDDKADVANGKKVEPPALNRRERRRLMREAAVAADDSDDEDGGFFEEG